MLVETLCRIGIKNNFIISFELSDKTNSAKTKLENYLEDNPIINNPINP